MLLLSSLAVFSGKVGAACFHLWDLLTPTPVSPRTKPAWSREGSHLLSLFFSATTKSKQHAGEGGDRIPSQGTLFSAFSKKSKAGLFPSLPFITSDFLCRKWLFLVLALSFKCINTAALGFWAEKDIQLSYPENLLVTFLGGGCFAKGKGLQSRAGIGVDGRRGMGQGEQKNKTHRRKMELGVQEADLQEACFPPCSHPPLYCPAEVRLLNRNMQKARDRDSVEDII